MIRIRNLKQTSYGAPSQWEAVTDEDQPVYVRYRHGELRVHVGPKCGTVSDAIGTPPVFHEEVGERLGSVLDWDEVVEATGIKLLEP